MVNDCLQFGSKGWETWTWEMTYESTNSICIIKTMFSDKYANGGLLIEWMEFFKACIDIFLGLVLKNQTSLFLVYSEIKLI